MTSISSEVAGVFVPNGLDALGEAWQGAEMALPPGYQLRGIWMWFDPYEGRYYRATADTGPGGRHSEIQETGDTPTEALLRLTAALWAWRDTRMPA